MAQDSHDAPDFAAMSGDAVLQHLQVTLDGLRPEEVRRRRTQDGENTFSQAPADTLCYRIRCAFINPFCIILAIVAFISYVTDSYTNGFSAGGKVEAGIIVIMIVIGGLLRFSQEIKAKHAGDQLRALLHTTVTVRRQGKCCHIAHTELVVGDIVLLTAGQTIPADIRLLQTADLFVSEAALTGESRIIEKTAAPAAPAAGRTAPDMAYMSTTVLSGTGLGAVIAVGNRTRYGKAARVSRPFKDSFQKGTRSISYVMLRFIFIFIPLIFILRGLPDHHWSSALAFSLAVAVGLIPEMLPMVLTACLAKGSISLSHKKTIVKNLNTLQGLGSLQVLCLDKTGTLTRENIVLEYFMDILGKESHKVLDLAYINSFYHTGIRNPIDTAILSCAAMPRRTDYYRTLTEYYHKLAEIPFDYTRKIATVLVGAPKKQPILIAKGNLKDIYKRCTAVAYENKTLPIRNGSFADVYTIVQDMLEDGMKVIAVAVKTFPKGTTVIRPQDEKDLTLLGYIAFFDAPKPSARISLEELKALHITPKLLTGDAEEIAKSVCRRVGIPAQHIVSGADLQDLDAAAFDATVRKNTVFAELSPEQKVQIVQSINRQPAMTGFMGDGINDMPALLAAHVGISVDTAVPATKDSADLVLLDKDLQILATAIREGRKTFTNMLKYLKITAGSNLGNIISVVMAGLCLPFLPMTSLQLLLLNLFYDALCIVLPWDTVDEEDIAYPKDWSGKHLGKFMLLFGSISAVFDGITFAFLYYMFIPLVLHCPVFSAALPPVLQEQYIRLFQTGWFLESLWTQIVILYFLRTSKMPFIESRPSWQVMSVTLAGLFVFTGLLFTVGMPVVGLITMPAPYFVFLPGICAAYILCVGAGKYIYIRKYKKLL